jgi:hypothetical protein
MTEYLVPLVFERVTRTATNALGTITRCGYCDCGTPDYITNAFGISSLQRVSQFAHDLQGNPTHTR